MNIKLAIKLIAVVMVTSIVIGSLLQSQLLAKGHGENGAQGNSHDFRYRVSSN